MELTGGGGAVDEMQAKADVVRRFLEMADGLRLDTMRAVVALLRPPQVVHFLVAVAELHLAVHHFGRRGVNPSWLAMSSNAHATAPPAAAQARRSAALWSLRCWLCRRRHSPSPARDGGFFW